MSDDDASTQVALVAGATRGAGRAIAIGLAEAGFFVYATGRSSRVAGPSEIGRPDSGSQSRPRMSPGESPHWPGPATRAAGPARSFLLVIADAYGITDSDGSRPDCWGYLAAYGWEREDGAGIEDFL